jgi:hypothetical protein
MGLPVDENNLDHLLWYAEHSQKFKTGHFSLDINLLRIAPTSFPKYVDEVHKRTKFYSRRHLRFLQSDSLFAGCLSICVSLRHFRETFKLSAVVAVNEEGDGLIME